MSAKEAFFLQAYENEDGEVEKITAPSQELMDQLDPQSENFNKELSDQYAEYLGQKIADREYENRGAKRSSKISADSIAEKKKKEQEEAQLQYNIDTYNDIRNTATTEELGYQIHDTKYQGAENPQNNKVDIKISSIKGTTQGAAMKKSMENQIGKDYNGTAPVIVVGVTLDGDGQVVARVKNVKSGVEAYVSWNKVASKQIYDAMRPEGKRLIDYKQPKVEFDPNNHSTD